MLGDVIETLDRDQREQMNDPEIRVDNQGRVKFTSAEGEVINYGRFEDFENAMMGKLRLEELIDEEAELVQQMINEGFAKGYGKGKHQSGNSASVGAWSVPLKPPTDLAAVKREFVEGSLDAIKDEKDDEPSNVPRDDVGTSSSSGENKVWIFVSARNEWRRQV